MLNTYSTTGLPVGTPTLADMLGASIQFIAARPIDRLPLVDSGLVIGYKLHKNTLYLKVQRAGRIDRWISEFDFLAYC